MSFMSVPSSAMSPLKDPIEELLQRDDPSVLALIVGVEGPSYRPVGAAMAIFADGTRAGTLSSGCIEADIAGHALETLDSGTPRSLRYGRGSPFMDIRLPCGGGLDILLLPQPDKSVLRQVTQARELRKACVLGVDTLTGVLEFAEKGETGWAGDIFRVRYLPETRFLVFGKGPEASAFTALVHAAGYPCLLLSPDLETRQEAEAQNCPTRPLVSQAMPADVEVDRWTAIALFFHDHDWEPPILRRALETPAFYIGSQGSQRARDERMLVLEAMGVSAQARARLHGPVGLIPSVRDARTLAVSVLAEVLAKAGRPGR